MKTEETTVADQMALLDARMKALESKGIDPVIEKDLMEELKKQDPEATVIKDLKSEVDPMESPTAHLAIASESVQTRMEDQANEGSKELMAIEKEYAERQSALQTFTDSIFRANAYMREGELKKSETPEFTDRPQDKEVDNYFKNEARIRAYDDMLFRGIADEYNKQATIFFDKEGVLNLESLKKFTEKKNQILNKEQEKLYNEIALELTKDEPNKMKLAFKARRIEELVNMQTTKDFSRKTIVELAKNSESVDIFRDRLEKTIKDTFKFTDEAISAFMYNQFGADDSKIIPFYQLYKKQTTVPAFKVGFEMKDGELEPVSTVYSREDPLAFSDEYGNTTLNRLEGL